LNTDPSLLQRAAALAAGQQSYPPATLYVVATPIGNLADISLRAIHVLGLADAVACEDTRVTAPLLRHLGWHKPLLAVHAHNEQAGAQEVLTRLRAGQSVAYVSDAGTPAVSDPGALLVAAVAAAGFAVVPIAGPSSALAALSAAGDVSAGPFTVWGFLPTKAGARRQALQQALASGHTQVLFEAPHRIGALLQDLAQTEPARQVTLCKELSKQFETVLTLQAAELPAWLAADPKRQRGEFVLVMHAPGPAASASGVAAADPTGLPTAAHHCLQVLMRELPLKQAVDLATQISGAPRKALYSVALQMRDKERDTEQDAGRDAGGDAGREAERDAKIDAGHESEPDQSPGAASGATVAEAGRSATPAADESGPTP